MKKNILFFFIITIVITGACSLQSQIVPSPVAVSQLIVTNDPNATQTSTPFQPQPPTSTAPNSSTISPVVTQSITLTEQITKNTTTVTPTQTITGNPEGQVLILVLGSDWRPNAGYRTDTIVLIGINPKNGTVSAVSFPRDLYVDIPGYGQERINTAQAHGFDVTVKTFEENFGVHLDYYVMTNLQGFPQLVDNLGGIDVDAAKNLTDHCKFTNGVSGYCSVGPGIVHMDGETALWYVRSRYSTSDFDRERRSQEVLKAMFERLMSLDVVNKVPDLFNIYKNNVETNLTLDVILPLVKVAPHLVENDMRIRSYTIGSDIAVPYRIPETGAQVLLPNLDAIRALMQQAFFE